MNARPAKPIIFYDFASVTGWCFGRPGETPVYGAQRLAPPESPPEAVFGGAIKLVAEHLKEYQPVVFCYEAPRDPRHMGKKTNIRTTLVTIGLCAVGSGVASRMGVYDVRDVDANHVRQYFLGFKPAKDEVKAAVIRRCLDLGFKPDDDNAADAIAGWHFMASVIDPDRMSYLTPHTKVST